MTTNTLRNIGIVAHVDAGKTTLTERILYLTGRIHARGEVHHGNTTTDFGVEEQKMGITISAAAVSCAWKGTTVQVIDTPGHADFTVEVERSLRVLDGAVLLVDAVAGVEPQTETVWRQANAHGVAGVAFVNKLDRAGADFDRAVASMNARLSRAFVPIQVPVYADDDFVGVIDLVHLRELRWGDDVQFTERELDVDAARAHRQRLIETLAEHDEELLEQFVVGQAIGSAELESALRRCTQAGTVVPVLAGSAFRNRGVQPLLDAIVSYLPAPDALGALYDASGECIAAERHAAERLSALCFKVAFDDHACLAFVRVYAGVLAKGQSIQAGERRVRVGRIVRLFADRREEVPHLAAGEIGAVLTTDLRTGQTLCDPQHVHALERVHAPPPVMEMGIEPCSQADRERLPKALGKLLIEDPSLRLQSNAETGQSTLAGMGQLHLEVAASQLFTRHRVKVHLGAPRVAYRESIRGSATLTHRHIKQSGGPGQFAVLTLCVEPCEADFAFVDETRGGVLSREYVRGIEKGCRSAMTHGVLGNHPLTGVRVRLLDGQMHSNDSSEHAFELAATAAFREACLRAQPVLLEPVMALEVHAPAPTCGAVLGDLGARRGRITSVQSVGEDSALWAEVPLAELFSYANALSSLTSGRGRHRMALATYEEVPKTRVDAVLRSA
ncbi:MAG: elongation factor G [Myxococcota bacterium]